MKNKRITTFTKVGLLLYLLTASLVFAEEPVEVYSKKEDGKYVFYAKSHNQVPIYLTVDFSRLENLQPDPSITFPYETAIPANQAQKLLFSLTRTQATLSSSYKIRYKYSFGDPNTAKHDDEHVYLFPFAHGTKQLISQGYNGAFTHKGSNKFSIDFALKASTPVYAARAGTVIEIKQDSAVGGISPKYQKLANYVLIIHEDGSFANYAHLQKDGVVVAKGERIKAGQLLGYSGNTGQSSGPHLHFSVGVPTKGEAMRSIPVRFLDHKGRSIEPLEYFFYYAFHPDGEPFQAVLGLELSEQDFQDYRVPVPIRNKISIRNEKIDHTFIKYLSNGCNAKVDVTVKILRLEGVTALTQFPRSITVPARTEVFLGLFRKKPNARRIAIRPEIRWQSKACGAGP